MPELSAIAPMPLAATLIVLLLVVITAVAIVANWLIRRSLAAPRVPERGVPDGVPWREVAIPGGCGKALFGWFVPAGEGAPALAIIHGWGGNAEMMLPLAKPLHAAGYALLFFDARNHGRSDGDTFSSLPRFAEDLEHAVDWLRALPGVDASRVGVIGHSVGAAAALLLAARRNDLAAVVTLAAFSHPATMMRRWLRSKRIPYWPLGAYILYYVQRVIGHRFDELAPCRSIREVNCPVLLVHGSEDETVPVSEAQEIYARRRDQRVRLLLIPGSHDQYAEMDHRIGEVIGFLDAVMPAAGDPQQRRIAAKRRGAGQ